MAADIVEPSALVERLRGRAEWHRDMQPDGVKTPDLLDEAATEIESMRAERDEAFALAATHLVTADALLAERDRLREALRPFVDAYRKHDDPGLSDLDSDQPVSWHVKLGAYRLARRLLPLTPEPPHVSI